MSLNIWVINVGSTSFKLAVFDSVLKEQVRHSWARDEEPAMLAWMQSQPPPARIGHRVVHGGPHDRAQRVTARLLEDLKPYEKILPLHLPENLRWVKRLQELFPHALHTASFDTAFHHHLDGPEKIYAVPGAWREAGVVRYGYHGLSFQSIAGQLTESGENKGKIIIAHLGGGASLCALDKGKNVGTTMGFSALDGLPMATRPGRIDPGILLYQLQAGQSVDELSHILHRECGLKGLSGISGDVRDLADSGQPEARAALDYYVHHVSKEIAALASVMQGLDMIVFTGGIGQHQPRLCKWIFERCRWLNPALRSLTLKTNEEQVIAAEADSLH